MTPRIAELDLVEIASDLPVGLIEGARGTVMAVHESTASVEFVGADGFAVGLFEVPVDELVVIERTGAGASFGHED